MHRSDIHHIVKLSSTTAGDGAVGMTRRGWGVGGGLVGCRGVGMRVEMFGSEWEAC